MCGIVGVASTKAVESLDFLEVQRDSLCHRGPDDSGLWRSGDGRVGLAHRRLAVIDLSPGGHQPMEDPAGRFCIVFNGEIYNFRELRIELEGRGHVFRSRSDTEVILAAYRQWGVDCLEHLSGMFAFGLYDGPRRRLFLARDRAGEKPLFYRLSNGTLSFASELKALMADPAFARRIDPEALDCYLYLGYVPGDRCILRGANKLPAAHAMTFELDDGRCHIWRYWRLPGLAQSCAGDSGPDACALVDELEALLEDAVRRQLVSDVPVGILLSGGVDSSLTTAMAVRSAADVRTFTIRFPGGGPYDETGHARLIARHFGTRHTELAAEPASVELLPVLARQYDEPIVDSSMIPTYLVSRLVRQHCTVALGGDGADELFGGYPQHGFLLALRRWTGWTPLALRRLAARLASDLLPTGFRGRNWARCLGSDLRRDLPLIAIYFDREIRRRLVPPVLWPREDGGGYAEALRRTRIPAEGDLLQRAIRMDFENFLAEDILVKVDRASMLNSLEVRAPWLDHRIIEFAYGKVPAHLKATHAGLKILPKQLCRKILPPGFDRHRKQGFSIPLGAWLRGRPWGGMFREILLDSREGLFDRACIEGLLEGHRRGRSNGERLFALAFFELWRREYRIMY